ncbi:putative ribonuclease H-like domain-containing protein [Tanacetum coccineum]
MMERELGEGYSFTKKKCFVCGSLSHLIKDCDYYEKKMARKAEVKKQRVFNTGNEVAKPVWTNANRVNHSNKVVLRSVQLNAGRPNTNSVRPNINTGRTNINSVRPRVNDVSSNVNTESAVKTSAGNKDQLEDFEEFNGGSVTFRATSDESKLWHRRLGHINFKNLNKLVKGNLVRGLPSKTLEENAIKHLGKVSENTSTSDSFSYMILVSYLVVLIYDSPCQSSKSFHKSETRIFDEASYDEEGVITDFNSLPTKIEVSPTPTLRIHNIHPKSQILRAPKSTM